MKEKKLHKNGEPLHSIPIILSWILFVITLSELVVDTVFSDIQDERIFSSKYWVIHLSIVNWILMLFFIRFFARYFKVLGSLILSLPTTEDNYRQVRMEMEFEKDHSALRVFRYYYVLSATTIPSFMHYVVFLVAYGTLTSEKRIYEYLALYVPLTVPFATFAVFYLFTYARGPL